MQNCVEVQHINVKAELLTDETIRRPEALSFPRPLSHRRACWNPKGNKIPTNENLRPAEDDNKMT